MPSDERISPWSPDNVTPEQVRQHSRGPGINRGLKSFSPTILLALGSVVVLFLALVLVGNLT